MRREYLVVGSDLETSRGTMYINEASPLGTPTVDWSKYSTFISHKSTDLRPAQAAARVLANAGLVGYLDRWDPNVNGDHPDLEDYLREVIRETPSILTIVSEATNTSWWVPFEIGVARETESQIATFLVVDEDRPTLDLPSYLRKWPILATGVELQSWCSNLQQVLKGPSRTRAIFMEGIAKMSAQDSPEREVSRLERTGRIRFIG